MNNIVVVIVSSIGLVVLVYGIRLLQEAVRGWLGSHPKPTQNDYIDWSKVPERFNWVAVDESGHPWSCIWFSREEPQIYKDDTGWYQSVPVEVPADAIIGPLPPWRESLRKRPGSEK